MVCTCKQVRRRNHGVNSFVRDSGVGLLFRVAIDRWVTFADKLRKNLITRVLVVKRLWIRCTVCCVNAALIGQFGISFSKILSGEF